MKSPKYSFKTITQENIQEPDPTYSAFVNLDPSNGEIKPIDKNEWIESFTKPQLKENVPEEIRAQFEVARGALIYSLYFYPLATLAMEQFFRIAESALVLKCKELWIDGDKITFANSIEKLVKKEIIPHSDEHWWHTIRDLQNKTSHPKRQQILPPGYTVDIMYDLATLDDIDGELDFDGAFTEEDIEEIFEDIPEDEHENIAMLMLAMPALQAVGFPTEKFVTTGDLILTDGQRKQVDWALELGYAIADMVDMEQQSRGKKKNNQAYTHARTIAKKFLPESEVDEIIGEIKTTYQRALRDMQ